LTDQQGNRVTDRDFRGKWLLIFFGYTHCPDVCPTTLSNLADTLAELDKAADRVQVLFMTLDPERDSPKVLLDYTAAFDRRIIGLTGSPEEIAATATAYHVKYAKAQSGDDYFVDHSALIHVLRPDGSYATFMFTDASGLQMAKRLRELMADA
jgi:protein SCO1/2